MLDKRASLPLQLEVSMTSKHVKVAPPCSASSRSLHCTTYPLTPSINSNLRSTMAMELKDLAPLLLQRERESSQEIDVELLTNTLRGGHAANVRRKNAEAAISQHVELSKRDAAFQNHSQRYNTALEKTFHYVKLIQSSKVDSDDQQIMYDAIGEKLPIQVHRSMFIPTLENQADDEQQAHWLPLANSYRILGAYAQTELGHGSNVQGLETTAAYDKNAQEFIINSPTLTSRKWWPGGLGKTATHAVVHAQLRIDGEHKGVQAFIVPLRSLKDHKPLRGVEVGTSARRWASTHSTTATQSSTTCAFLGATCSCATPRCCPTGRSSSHRAPSWCT